MGPERQALRAPLDTRREGFRSAVSSERTRKKGETSSLMKLMPDSQLNGAERALQHLFSKSSNFMHIFNGLIVGLVTFACFEAINELPQHRPLPPATVPLAYHSVPLAAAGNGLRLAGAWELQASDPRLGGLSALALDRGRFLAVTDRGAVLRFDRPGGNQPRLMLADLRDGPGPFARKWARDAESLARDPNGRGWWVGYEQRHTLWLYGDDFDRALAHVDLSRMNWRDNRGAEGLVVRNGELVALGENGQDAVRMASAGPQPLKLHSDAAVAEAARAPDGGIWVLLRRKSLQGIDQSIAPLFQTHDGYRAGREYPVPKSGLDNYEGMAIEARPDGSWRFWLISDDGHRVMARTLLVALDLQLPVRHDKSPAPGAGLSKKPPVETP